MTETVPNSRRPNPFYKGHPKWGGRPKGGKNKRTKAVAEVIEIAGHKMGGVKGLVKWAQSDPANATIFWRDIWARLLPLQVGVRNEVEHSIAPRTAEELAAALERHGLPPLVFGMDKPVLELPGTLAGGPVLDAVAAEGINQRGVDWSQDEGQSS
jgi:hypothetical protein